MENILPSSNLYDIKVAENRMLCCITSSRKKMYSFVLRATCENMEDVQEYSKLLLLLYPKIFPVQLT